MSIFFQGKDDPISHLSRPRLWSLEPAKVLRCGWAPLEGSAKAPQNMGILARVLLICMICRFFMGNYMIYDDICLTK